MPDTPSIVIIGGSNSLLRNGWVDRLKQLHPDPARVMNLSIGAATTAMGLYRLLSARDLPPDPVIVWEYALNEANYAAHGQSVPVMLYHLRWLFEICARRGYPVLPLLLYNKTEAMGETKGAYRMTLKPLLNRYGLKPLDADWFWKHRFAHLDPDRLYADEPHYATDTRFPQALARRVLVRAAQASPPFDSEPCGVMAGRDLHLVIPKGPGGETFTNRILSCQIHSLDRPVHIDMKGRPLACVLISSRAEPAIGFRSGWRGKEPYSARIAPSETGPPVQLKHLLLWTPEDPPLQVDGRLTIAPKRVLLRAPVVQHTMSWASAVRRPDAAGDIRRGGLIGVLAEVDL